jgi:hypothetical protein
MTQSPVQASARPPTATFAIWCFALALFIGCGLIAFAWGFYRQAGLTFLTIGVLIVLVARRQNWARWTLTIVTIASLIMMWPLIRFQLTYGTAVAAATCVQIMLEILGCILLFLPRSSGWYRGTQPAG